MLMSKKYNIDDSHGISHSMNILNFAYNIYEDEKYKKPDVQKFEKVIYISAILHDMCDKKYVNEQEGINEINKFLDKEQVNTEEIQMINNIISTLSYSTVKKNGFPKMENEQLLHAYHIVRESDLLTSYDFDRCLIYNIYNKNNDIKESFNEANQLFQNRVFKHYDDKLLLLDYSKKKHFELESKAIYRINTWKKLLQKSIIN
jgi:hypothetical protein